MLKPEKHENRLYVTDKTKDPYRKIWLAARVSKTKKPMAELIKEAKTTDPLNLVLRLVKSGHLTPLEWVKYDFIIENMPRTVMAQLTRHRLASFDVESQRDTDGFRYAIPGRISQTAYEKDYINDMSVIEHIVKKWIGKMTADKVMAKRNGAEIARNFIPQGCSVNVAFTMNLRQMLKYLSLRLCHNAQIEHQELAHKIFLVLLQDMPEILAVAKLPCGYCEAKECLVGPAYKKPKK